MQERNEFNETLASQMLDPQRGMEQISQALAKQDVRNVVVAKMPARGTVFELGGLQFVVKFVDHKRGKFHAELAGQS